MLIKVIIAPKDNVVTGKAGLSGYCACPVENPGKTWYKNCISALVSRFSDCITDRYPWNAERSAHFSIFLSESSYYQPYIREKDIVLLYAIPNGKRTV